MVIFRETEFRSRYVYLRRDKMDVINLNGEVTDVDV